MITDTIVKTTADTRSADRSRPCIRHLPSAALAVVALFLATSPAFAVLGVGIAEIQEEQVERFLQHSFDKNGGDRVWSWETMVQSCTEILMHGSPEQDPEQSRVRFTPDAQRFLRQCAVVKGFRPLPAGQ